MLEPDLVTSGDGARPGTRREPGREVGEIAAIGLDGIDGQGPLDA